MDFDLGYESKTIRQLRKLLKSLPCDPSIKAVHDLRTRTRRIEAIAGVIIPGHEKSRRHLMQILKLLRKAAGDVRDMDVLAAKARTLSGHTRDESVAHLLEHLRASRIESARALVDTVNEQRKDADDSLKTFSKQLDKHLHSMNSGAENNTNYAKPCIDAAISLVDELSRWPAFDAQTLHAFRIKVKELRYSLRLMEGPDLKFVRALDKTKTQIGNWHDWQELRKIAGDVLDPKMNRSVLKEIDEIVSEKLKLALAAARTLKARCLSAYRGFTITES
jgi:CHAD domain-containing protein